MYHKIDIKPFSINKRSVVRYFKGKACIANSDEYKAYCESLFYLLPRSEGDYSGKLKLHLVVGVSNANADTDNTLKGIIDAMEKRYKFNDANIYLHDLMKIVVPKGREFIGFKLTKVSDGSYEKKVAKVLDQLK